MSRPRPHGAEPDRLPPHRRRAHVPLQLAVRARRAAASACCGSRTPTRAARWRRRPSRSSARCAWLGIDWDGPVTFQLDRMERCQRGGAPAGRGGTAYEDEGAIRFRMPDEGVDRLGRRRPRPDRVPERAARGPRHRPLGRPADLQLRLAGRGLARRDHARDPRRRPRLEHAEADPDPARARLRAPVYAHVPNVNGDGRARSSRSATARSRSTSSATAGYVAPRRW